MIYNKQAYIESLVLCETEILKVLESFIFTASISNTMTECKTISILN